MVKNVNVEARVPVYNVLKMPVIGKLLNIRLSSGQIYTCLAGGARVEEILSDGSTVLLNAHNYNKVNEVKKTNIITDDAARKAAEEAQKLAELEAAQKAEEEAKRKAEEETKKLAEEAARKAAEDKRKEEEAKRLAAEQAKKEAQEKAKNQNKPTEEPADKEDTTSKNNNSNKDKK